jgi:predicted alpha/beta hydrolase
LLLVAAAAGFDVWLPNTRGNVFSRGNYQYSYREHEYWYHSIDEYALIDNPVMIDKALEVSGASKLAFVGHSQVQMSCSWVCTSSTLYGLLELMAFANTQAVNAQRVKAACIACCPLSKKTPCRGPAQCALLASLNVVGAILHLPDCVKG